jgi:RNA recognition motif-containing protein
MAMIYMSNLQHPATASDVRRALVVYGKVLNADIVGDHETGDPRGFALVEMAGDMEAATAIKGLSRCQFRGKSITVHEARSNAGRPRGGDGRGW